MEMDQNIGGPLMFIDAIRHGSARRISSGLRRMTICHHRPNWGYLHCNIVPGKERLALPERSCIAMPDRSGVAVNG